MRQTDATVKVAIALCAQPRERHWGYPLTKLTGLRSGTLYPILNSMLAEGFLTDGWEDVDPATAKRPPRRYYELTADGLRELGAMVRRAEIAEAARQRGAGAVFT